MSRKLERDRFIVELHDYAPGFPWAEQFVDVLRNFDSLELQILNAKAVLTHRETPSTCQPDLHVMAVSPEHFESGIDVVVSLRQSRRHIPILALTDGCAAKPLLRLMEAGASDLLAPPWHQAEVMARFERLALRTIKTNLPGKPATSRDGLESVVGKSLAINSQLERVKRYAFCNAAVLITGETGTGKEVFARAIHYHGPRQKQPFIAVNCAALPGELVENELFGHQPGAFTGAGKGHRGLISQAETGTLFLDEIESLPNAVQAKLLRFLQEREYRPLGGATSRQVDVRVIAASNADLASMSSRGLFRRDLYFRLNVLPLVLPPLRQRRDDIPLLVSHLVERHTSALGKELISFSKQAVEKLMSYSWPGNVRELENVIQRTLTICDDSVIQESAVEITDESGVVTGKSFKAQKARAVKEFERSYLANTLAQSNGNVSQAARAANKDRRSFSKLLRKHGVRFDEQSHPRPASL